MPPAVSYTHLDVYKRQELVIDNENGLLFDPAHSSQMAEHIIELALDKEKRARYGAAGKQKVLAEFTIEKGVENLWQRFLQLDKN